MCLSVNSCHCKCNMQLCLSKRASPDIPFVLEDFIAKFNSDKRLSKDWAKEDVENKQTKRLAAKKWVAGFVLKIIIIAH